MTLHKTLVGLHVLSCYTVTRALHDPAQNACGSAVAVTMIVHCMALRKTLVGLHVHSYGYRDLCIASASGSAFAVTMTVHCIGSLGLHVLSSRMGSSTSRQVSLLRQRLLLAVLLLRRVHCAACSPLVWALLAQSSLTASILRYAPRFWWSFGWLNKNSSNFPSPPQLNPPCSSDFCPCG